MMASFEARRYVQDLTPKGSPLFTELPTRRVFSESGLPVYDVLGNSAGMKRGPKWLCSGLIPSLFIISQARRNVVVAPGRILAINGFVLPMLLLLLLGVVLPRVDAFVRHPSFLLLDVVDDGSKVCATPTGAYGTSGS